MPRASCRARVIFSTCSSAPLAQARSCRPCGQAQLALDSPLHSEHLDLATLDAKKLDDPSMRPKVLTALRRIVAGLGSRVPREVDRDALVGELADEALGLGPLERFLSDGSITEIMVVDPNTIYIEQDGKIVLSRGVDELFDLSTNKSAPPSVQRRAAKALARDEVRAKASAATVLVLDFRSAKRCEDKRELLAPAREIGDARILPSLKAMKNPRGCGFMGMRDCYPCVRKDGSLEDAINAIEARSRK